MIPLTEQLFYQIHGSNEPEWILPSEGVINIIEQQILESIGTCKVAYVEADYWGGEGGQMAIIWEEGKRVKELSFGHDRINEVLRDFGAKPENGIDEFETVGLRRERNTYDW